MLFCFYTARKIVPSVPKGAHAKPRSTQQPKNCSNSAAGVTLHRSSYSLASFPDDQRSRSIAQVHAHTPYVARTPLIHPHCPRQGSSIGAGGTRGGHGGLRSRRVLFFP
uniref:(northern house mosquito) hypothetical protein n=1 Tax=Culex pipiens TaxID=7175 RepID=A0A8D8JPH7_CULPI